jgi:RNA-directed DNA polymerase
MTFARIEASGLERWLAGLREELVSKTYRPDPVRRVSIPKPDGGERPLGIPTIRGRTRPMLQNVQGAVHSVWWAI